MKITAELCVAIYDFLEKEFNERLDYLEEISKKLNINTDELIKQVKEIVSNDLYSQRKDKDLTLSVESIKILLSTFLDNYKICKELEYHFFLSKIGNDDLSKIKTISLKDYYISCASDMLRFYKKDECKEINTFYIYWNKGKYINLYNMKIDFPEEENYINDILEIYNNIIIVLFINYIFLFKIENNNFNMIFSRSERFKLIKCAKYDSTKILVGSEGNLLIFEKMHNFSLQKIAKYDFRENIRKSYYFFNNMIVVDNNLSIRIFSIDKKFKLTNIKKEFIINKNKLYKICYIKKYNMFILLENYLTGKKIILTDFDKIYDEKKLSIDANFIQEFSENDDFWILMLKEFCKYKVENNKLKLIFNFKIKKIDRFQEHFHILQISDKLYFITGMNGFIIYESEQNDEQNVNNDNN